MSIFNFAIPRKRTSNDDPKMPNTSTGHGYSLRSVRRSDSSGPCATSYRDTETERQTSRERERDKQRERERKRGRGGGEGRERERETRVVCKPPGWSDYSLNHNLNPMHECIVIMIAVLTLSLPHQVPPLGNVH